MSVSVENILNVSCRRFPQSRVLPALLAAACVAVPTSASAADLNDQILVRHRAVATAADRAEVRADAGVRLDERLPLTGVELVETTAGETRSDALDALRGDPDVVWAEPNREVSIATNDSFWPYQYGLENLGGNGRLFDADADLPEAWTASTGSGVTVGVVDTGVRSDHPDLDGQLVPGEWYLNDGNASTQDFNGHGTHVAGIIAAISGNNLGVSGAAPDAEVKAFRALGANGKGTSAAVATAFASAGAQGLRVVNASLGSASSSSAERQAIQSSPGTLFVVAAGNESLNVDGSDGTSYPCRYTYENVLCVGASTEIDTAADFSNRGQVSVDLFAPGDDIASTFYDPDLAKVGYARLSGTSMASPLVAAAAALVAARHPTWSPVQIKDALLGSVDHPESLAGVSATGGRLNAARALGVDVGPDGQAPIAPAAVSAIGSPGRVDLTWTASSALDLKEYRVYRAVAGAWNVVATVAGASAALTGLGVGESLTLRVTAVDRSGEESAASPTVTVAADAGQIVVAPGTTGSTGTDPGAGSGGTAANPSATSGAAGAPATGGNAGATTPQPAPTAPGATPPTGTPTTVVPLVTNLRPARTRGRVRAVRFNLSAPATVSVLATRARTKLRPAVTRKRTVALGVGAQTVAVDRTARGLALPPGQWRLTVSVGDSRRTTAFRLP